MVCTTKICSQKRTDASSQKQPGSCKFQLAWRSRSGDLRPWDVGMVQCCAGTGGASSRRGLCGGSASVTTFPSGATWLSHLQQSILISVRCGPLPQDWGVRTQRTSCELNVLHVHGHRDLLQSPCFWSASRHGLLQLPSYWSASQSSVALSAAQIQHIPDDPGCRCKGERCSLRHPKQSSQRPSYDTVQRLHDSHILV